MIAKQMPDSQHIRLQTLVNGVYAAIHISGSAAISNAGIVDLGDRTLDSLVRQMVAEGEAEERIDTMPIPASYDDWLFSALFSVNMHFLYQLRQGEQEDVEV